MVEGNGLENRRAGNGTEGSNPSLSAIFRDMAHRACVTSRQQRKIIVQCSSCFNIPMSNSVSIAWRGTQVAEGDGLLNR